ncbi:MAG: circularly permuted type 2 ATP-grasp protein, partial [bacterium]|nr:circularly permuted type 2 ATP-grasp protein [bacterium]
MKLEKKVIEAQQKLSKVNIDFHRFVGHNPEALKASSFKLLDINDILYVLQPWPTFINRETKNSFKEAGVEVFELIKQIPERIFGNDTKKISAYYGISELVAGYHMEGVTHEHLDHLIARGDFLIGPSGLKCLEFNVSANLGGWYVPIWESLYLNTPVIDKFLKEYNVKPNNENLIMHEFENIIRLACNKMKPGETEVNIALVGKNFVNAPDSDMHVYLNKLYDTTLKKKDPNLKGTVFLCEIQLLQSVDNQVYFGGERIHTVIEMYHGVVSPNIINAFKEGNIGLLDGPITNLISSKLNLALLSDYEDTTSGIFNDKEKEIIDKYVPWSRKLIPGNTTYLQERVDLPNLVLENKDNFVLKPSVGYGGEGVCIGLRVSEKKWGQLIRKALVEKNWLVQEIAESTPALHQNG